MKNIQLELKNYIREHYSEKSIPRYTRLIEQFKTALGDKTNQSNYQDIMNYIGLLRERNLHPKSLRNHLHSIKIYFRYLIETEIREDHPCENLYLKDQINKSILVESLYTKEELEQLYNEYEITNKSEVIQCRNKIILGLLIYQALTTTEIIELKLGDTNLIEGTIRIKGNDLKSRNGNKGRTLTLKSKQILMLHEYIKKQRKELLKIPKPSKRTEYLILSDKGLQLWGSYINRMLNQFVGNKYSPLKIRQSIIANFLKENNDIRIVQEFAGHRRTGSTEAYKRTGLEELKASVEKLHPLQ